jgi:sec-independent protein translocase protein TatA
MGSFSIWHWLIVLAVVMILFGGGGKISRIMSDMAKGVNAFKKGLKEEEAPQAESPKPITAQSTASAAAAPGPAPSAAPVMREDEAAKG